jgi:glycosyltransferase involved in cell wall biosynthesis
MSTITVLTLVPNAGDRLARCLESVQWADDRFCIVDPNTADGSDEVARRYSDHVVTHRYENKAAQCNWALPQVETEWTLVLDADEWVSEALRDAIRAVTRDPAARDGYRIRRESLFMGRWMKHSGLDRDYNLRLFRTRKGRYDDRLVHATVLVDGTVGRIDAPMYHDDKRDFQEYFQTFHRFTEWAARDRYAAGQRCGLFDLTVRPVAKFVKTYVVRQGFRDGYHGAVYAGLAAFNVFTKYAKLWRLEQLEGEDAGGERL